MLSGTSGYESPTEETPSGSVSRDGAPGLQLPISVRALRSPASTRGNLPTNGPDAGSSSLNGMLCKMEMISSRKVGIRDRIACYQWTWFTMVCFPVNFRSSMRLEDSPGARVS